MHKLFHQKQKEWWGSSVEPKIASLMLAGQSRIIYDFGVETVLVETLVVLRLIMLIPRNRGSKLVFENWFSTLNLMVQLKIMGILSTATCCKNHLKGCPLPSDKELKNKGGGSDHYDSDVNSGLHMIK